MTNTLTKASFLTIEPEGYISAANAQAWKQELTAAISSIASTNISTILVDMTKLEFLDSAGLMSLISAYHLAESLGKSLSICSLTPGVKMVFELTQLDDVLDIYENRTKFESNQAEVL